ncbi:nucleotidyltransferase family protein [candidate division KSB1 bacterium]|nr:nucleotidyltransferase family protein [candidate division KSB1 bacterium]
MPDKIQAIILAAGESRRMGRLKPLLRIGDKTALGHIVEQLQNAAIDTIHIVVGYEAERIIRESGVAGHFVVNERYPLGQFSSLQRGIAALSECAVAAVCLVDQPQIQPAWILALIAGLQPSIKIVRPSFHGSSGHPVLYTQSLFQEILAMPPTATAKELMRSYAAQTVFVDMDSEAILYDADTPADFAAMKRWLEG